MVQDTATGPTVSAAAIMVAGTDLDPDPGLDLDTGPDLDPDMDPDTATAEDLVPVLTAGGAENLNPITARLAMRRWTKKPI